MDDLEHYGVREREAFLDSWHASTTVAGAWKREETDGLWFYAMAFM